MSTAFLEYTPAKNKAAPWHVVLTGGETHAFATGMLASLYCLDNGIEWQQRGPVPLSKQDAEHSNLKAVPASPDYLISGRLKPAKLVLKMLVNPRATISHDAF